MAAATAALICRLCLAIFTYGTNDASMWESSAAIVRDTGGGAIYKGLVEVRDPEGKPLHRQVFNHPPFMIRVLAGMNAVKVATGIPVRVTLRLVDAAADVGTVILTAAILRHLFGSIPLPSMLLVVIAPAWMCISGFHANSDPLLVFFLVLTVYLAEVRACTGWAMVAFAFATGIKVVPIVLFPALFLWCNSWRERVRALLIIATFWLVTACPWLIHTPAAMMGHIFGYRSPTGLWGIGLLLVESHSDRAWLFNSYGQYLMAVVLVLAAVLMNRGGKRAFLFCQFGVLLFLFHLLTPGFGIQYLAWLIPWATVLPWRLVAAHVIASSAFCAAVYTYWSGGAPWYYANSVTVGPWGWLPALIGLVVWFTVAVAIYAYWRGGLLQRRQYPWSGVSPDAVGYPERAITCSSRG
ncbi:MAG: rane protein [Bryobacterales bacterium]|nr:rane protein [Bryobacterales bacterium]